MSLHGPKEEDTHAQHAAHDDGYLPKIMELDPAREGKVREN